MPEASTASDLFKPPPSALRASTPDGELVIWQEHPGLIAEIGRGIFSLPLAHKVMQFFDPILAAGVRGRVFVDFERVTEYTREARDILTAYSQRRSALLEGVHLLLSSKLVALWVGSFKHDMGDPLVHSYTDRASFLRSYADSLRDWESGRRPAPAP